MNEFGIPCRSVRPTTESPKYPLLGVEETPYRGGSRTWRLSSVAVKDVANGSVTGGPPSTSTARPSVPILHRQRCIHPLPTQRKVPRC